jgi:hypothetical protein
VLQVFWKNFTIYRTFIEIRPIRVKMEKKSTFPRNYFFIQGPLNVTKHRINRGSCKKLTNFWWLHKVPWLLILNYWTTFKNLIIITYIVRTLGKRLLALFIHLKMWAFKSRATRCVSTVLKFALDFFDFQKSTTLLALVDHFCSYLVFWYMQLRQPWHLAMAAR